MSDGLVQKPFVLRVDRQGFIMPSKIHDHPDLTIAFLGGSTTECTYVDEDNRFPYLAGRLLERQTHLKVNSYNAGRSGNNTLHCLNVLLNKVVNLKPDIVVLMENINDLAILMYEKTYWNDQSLPVAPHGETAEFQDRGPGPGADLPPGPGPDLSQPLPGIEEIVPFRAQRQGG